jgi:epoxyqueuosine reductase
VVAVLDQRARDQMLIAIGNSVDVTLAPDAKRLLDDLSPLIRGAAVWALSRLMAKN